MRDFLSSIGFATEELDKNRFYKFAGMIYHDHVLGTLIAVRYRTRYLRKKLDKNHPRTTILLLPDKPDHSHILYKICNSLGLTMSSSTASRPDVVMAFEDVTKRRHHDVLTALSAEHFVVNQRCNDISKTKVEQVFREVFGYGTFVDPATFQGLCVMKSDDNAMHDGTLVQCPTVPTRHDVVYQRVINNREGHEVVDIRVPIVGRAIPLIYWKYRDARFRFSNWNDRAIIGAPDSAFSESELASIRAFSEKLGLDFGELDVLRDSDDGRIYIVDVNNTPCGPPNHLGKAESKQAVDILSRSFHDEFVRRTPSRDGH